MIFRLIIGSFVLLDLLWWWWADRRLRPLRRHRLWRTLLGVMVVLLAGSLLAWLTFPHQMRNTQLPPLAVLNAAIFIWHLVLLPLGLVLALASGLVQLALWSSARLARLRIRPAPADPLPVHLTLAPAIDISALPSRRHFLGAAVAAVPPLLLATTVPVALGQVGTFRVRRLSVPLADLPPELDGLTIAHVTDVHVGRFMPPEALAAVVKSVNAMDVDLVLMTGDLIDFAVADLPPALEWVRQFRARHGLAMCVGNHDLIENPAEFVRGVRRAGVPLLIDQWMTIPIGDQRLELAGLGWGRGDAALRSAMDRLLSRQSLQSRRQAGGFPLLLSHHPHGFDPAAEVGFPLTLAGHTHGGQIMVNERLGAGFIIYRYVTGLYRKGASALVVSNGVGNWFPLRVRAPSEIIHLTLRRVDRQRQLSSIAT